MVRVKRRYILLKYNNNNKKGQQITDSLLLKTLRDQVQQVYGDFGLASFERGLSLKRHDAKEGVVIICVRKGVHELVMSVVPLLTRPCSFNIIHLSGTMRGCLKNLKQDYLMNLRASIASQTTNRK